MKTIILAAVIGLLATGAAAHSPLHKTVPADAAVLTVAPSQIVLGFKATIRLTRVRVTHADAPAVDLDLSAHKSFASDFSLPMEAAGSGAYAVEWRGLGEDGHAQVGSFTFVVD